MIYCVALLYFICRWDWPQLRFYFALQQLVSPCIKINTKINMNWLYNICSCITPQLKTNIIDYLNSTQLNRQVAEQQKCSQSQEPDIEPSDHVYKMAKSRSVNFMKLEEKSDDEDQQGREQFCEKGEEGRDQVIDAFWYGRLRGRDRMENYRYLLEHKSKVLGIIFEHEPNTKGYDKIYDSQDEICLLVHSKLQSLPRGKKVNSYRFSFNIPGVKLEEYEKWVKEVQEKSIFPLLQEAKQIQTDPEDPSLKIIHRYYKKLLVVSPHEFMTAQKTFAINQEQKSLLTVIFSVEQGKESKNELQTYNRGWLHLSGIEAIQTETGLHFNGYFCVELDVSVSPNMLKQPIAKQIRIFVQKMICSIRKTDQI